MKTFAGAWIVLAVVAGPCWAQVPDHSSPGHVQKAAEEAKAKADATAAALLGEVLWDEDEVDAPGGGEKGVPDLNTPVANQQGLEVKGVPRPEVTNSNNETKDDKDKKGGKFSWDNIKEHGKQTLMGLGVGMFLASLLGWPLLPLLVGGLVTSLALFFFKS